MKSSINFFRPAILFFCLVISSQAYSQDKKANIKNIIESKNFVFKVQTINPTSGISRQSNSEYDLKVLNDSLISYLPYFGRAYSAPSPGDRGGFNFTSSRFDYNVANKKKGGWDISIKPKDVQEIKEFSLSVSEKGYATLRAISNNRQPISYSGYIAAVK